ncbi:hypothetical protein SAMN05421682_10955 [Chryseobacterium indoltheticum]|uniref:Uncharacterized protein n=1 Tax=Chryseobacterium indoltheticum TaxID=254 RepID=A0A381F6E5_9FLAO|nr:hypothetical protein SAMN05421682_10955 [Chryseobacterium indoltheticum]SUX42067.1 Uncharacterised protein [Chryseobacterium indoltheticum]
MVNDILFNEKIYLIISLLSIFSHLLIRIAYYHHAIFPELSSPAQ